MHEVKQSINEGHSKQPEQKGKQVHLNRAETSPDIT